MAKLDSLQNALGEAGEDILLSAIPFLEALRAFSLVVETCFGNKLVEGYGEHIGHFKTKYLNLNISVTPNVNVIVRA